MATPLEDDGFTSVTYKKPQQQRAAKNRRGKNRFRERTLEEKLQSREAELRRTGYLQQCRGESPAIQAFEKISELMLSASLTRTAA